VTATVKIELAIVEEILRESLSEDIHSLEGVVLWDNDSTHINRAEAAEVTRDLLHLADHLDLAANLVRQQYWRAKGYTGISGQTLVPRGVE